MISNLCLFLACERRINKEGKDEPQDQEIKVGMQQGVVNQSTPQNSGASPTPSMVVELAPSSTPSPVKLDVLATPSTVAELAPSGSPSPLPSATPAPVLAGIQVSRQFPEVRRQFILRELAKIPLLELPRQFPYVVNPAGLEPYHTRELHEFLESFKKHPLLLIEKDVLDPDFTLSKSILAYAIGSYYFDLLLQRRRSFKDKPQIFNEQLESLKHEYPLDPTVLYKFEFNHVIQVGSLFDYDPTKRSFASVADVFITLVHELQHFQGEAFLHGLSRSGKSIDRVSNGPYSISVPLYDRFLIVCRLHRQFRQDKFPFESKLPCDDASHGELLARREWNYYSSSLWFSLPDGPVERTKGSVIAPL